MPFQLISICNSGIPFAFSESFPFVFYFFFFFLKSVNTTFFRGVSIKDGEKKGKSAPLLDYFSNEDRFLNCVNQFQSRTYIYMQSPCLSWKRLSRRRYEYCLPTQVAPRSFAADNLPTHVWQVRLPLSKIFFTAHENWENRHKTLYPRRATTLI